MDLTKKEQPSFRELLVKAFFTEPQERERPQHLGLVLYSHKSV